MAGVTVEQLYGTNLWRVVCPAAITAQITPAMLSERGIPTVPLERLPWAEADASASVWNKWLKGRVKLNKQNPLRPAALA